MNPAFLILPILLAATGVSVAVTADSGNAYVEHVIDGDTVVLGDGSRVRLVGIDAPEEDEPCGQRATEAMRRMVEHRVVTVGNPDSVQDTDKYGRLLRYLDTDADPAASLLTDGLATARYDSTDGYDPHPRQGRYHALEALAIAACPTLDPNSRWYNDPDRYRKHVKDLRLAREKLKREAQAERRKERDKRREAQRREDKRELERTIREMVQSGREAESATSDSGQPDDGYTRRRCYAPGGQTWTPC